ncbi:MAG: Gfo/Idh/MocA family oxidoreductase [Aliishimia sp.]
MIGVAILGAGIGAQHLDGYHALPDAYTVRWVIDLDVHRARAVKTQAAITNRIEDAFEDPDVQIIDICLPPHLHVPVALQALQVGKHVICEKPIATSLEDIEKLRKAQRASGCQVFPVFQYRFGPAFTALTALREAGLTGAPIVAAMETHWARGADYYAIPWRGTWAGEQGGAVLSHAIHAHDLMCCHMGHVAAVSGAVATLANGIETEDCAALTFELEGGAIATSSITLGAAIDETRLRFVYNGLTATSGSTPYAPGQSTWTFTARDPSKQGAIDALLENVTHRQSGFAGAFDEVAKALTNQPHHAVMFEDGATSVELVTAIYDAARNKHRVALPLSPNHAMRKGWQL